jgi:hypothetical protein
MPIPFEELAKVRLPMAPDQPEQPQQPQQPQQPERLDQILSEQQVTQLAGFTENLRRDLGAAFPDLTKAEIDAIIDAS